MNDALKKVRTIFLKMPKDLSKIKQKHRRPSDILYTYTEKI